LDCLTTKYVIFLFPPYHIYYYHYYHYYYFTSTPTITTTSNMCSAYYSGRDAWSPSRDYPKPWLDYLYESGDFQGREELSGSRRSRLE
jgi:hypothetical protein